LEELKEQKVAETLILIRLIIRLRQRINVSILQLFTFIALMYNYYVHYRWNGWFI